MTHRPEWTIKAFDVWHKQVCDISRPETCGYEGQPWFEEDGRWGRISLTTGKAVMFSEDGSIETGYSPWLPIKLRVELPDGWRCLFGSKGL